MFDTVIFLVRPEDTMLMLPVIFIPPNVSFSLRNESDRVDLSFFRNLHDDSSINGVSICEDIPAINGVVLNVEFCYRHFPTERSCL